MKFEYDNKQDERECVAYLLRCGGTDFLYIKEIDGGYTVISKNGGSRERRVRFDPSDATHRFYPGDKITITF